MSLSEIHRGAILMRIAQRGPSMAICDARGECCAPWTDDPMPLDRATIPLLARLWALGLPTNAACSGHWRNGRMSLGYVGIRLATPAQWRVWEAITLLWFRDELRIPAGMDIAVERSSPWWEREDDGQPGIHQSLTITITNHHQDARIAQIRQIRLWWRLARTVNILTVQ